MSPSTDPSAFIAHAVVPEGAATTRLDRAAAAAFSTWLGSRAAARKACKRGDVWLNGAPAASDRHVHPGDALALAPRTTHLPAVFSLAMPVAFEDDHWAVVVKPAGLPVHGNRHATVTHALPHNLRPSPLAGALPRPQPVHRLDIRTTGLLVVGKTSAAVIALSRAFAERRVDKRYRAIVHGRVAGDGASDAPLDARDAHTRWSAVETHPSGAFGCLTTVDVWPRTGRTHQIRRHLADQGHPVLGDDLYGTPGHILRRRGLFLAAVALTLAHPASGEPVRVRVDEPAKFAAFRRRHRP